jgi:hypothetical protein
LFREGRAATTLLLWLINFMNIYNLYRVVRWLPTIATQLGYYRADQRVDAARRSRSAGPRHVLVDLVHQAMGIHPGADDRFLVAFCEHRGDRPARPCHLWVLVTSCSSPDRASSAASRR